MVGSDDIKHDINYIHTLDMNESINGVNIHQANNIKETIKKVAKHFAKARKPKKVVKTGKASKVAKEVVDDYKPAKIVK